MKIIQRINPIRNYLHCLALAAFALATTPAHTQVILGGDFQLYKPGSNTVTAEITSGWGVIWGTASPTNMSVSGGGLLTYSDSTTGTEADLLQWTKTRGGANILPNGSGGSHALNAFATWGGHTQVETVGSIYTVAANQTVTISVMVGGGVGGPMGSDLTFVLYDTTHELPIVASSSVNVNPADNAPFQMISRTYGASALAGHIGSSTKIVLGAELTNDRGGAIIYDDVSLVTSVPDTTPPTLISIVDNKGGGPIDVNEPVTYTVTFSEPMSAATVDASDFANTSSTAINVNSVTQTVDHAVFLVEVTPIEAGTLRLQIVADAVLTDYEGNALDTNSALLDDTTLVVDDLPPTPTTIELVSSGDPTTYGQNVTFTATVSPIPSGGTVQFWDGGNYLGLPVTVNTSTGVATVNTTALGAATHEITADYSGNFQFEASTSAVLSHEVNTAPLTVRALNTLRPPNTPNPDPLPYQITGYQNGENIASSGVTGTPDLSTDAVLESPVGDYVITCAIGTLAASNYSFTLENGTLTIAVPVNTFSVNFYAYGGLTTPEAQANVRVGDGIPAGFGDWVTSGWSNFQVPWAPNAPLPPVTLTSNQGSTSTFTFKDCRNGGPYMWATPRTTLLGDGNGNMMDAHVNSTLQTDDVNNPNKFDMEVTGIPFAVYDVIFYIGANQAQFGDGTGVIVFNGGTERAFTLKPGAFDGTFTEMVDATTQGNYIVFPGVTGSSFTTQTWGTGPGGFNHLGPNGFQIRQAGAVGSGFTTWADANNATGQTPDQDHDNDGVQNGIEYFMGETGSSFTAMPGLDGTNTVTWPMDPAYDGTYEVQTSPDLVIWTNVDPRPLPTGGNLNYTLPSGLGKQFVRLLVTPTP